MTNQDVDACYLEKQRRRYEAATGDDAYDALWRAASAADLLDRDESSQDDFTPDRVAELVRQLGWSQR